MKPTDHNILVLDFKSPNALAPLYYAPSHILRLSSASLLHIQRIKCTKDLEHITDKCQAPSITAYLKKKKNINVKLAFIICIIFTGRLILHYFYNTEIFNKLFMTFLYFVLLFSSLCTAMLFFIYFYFLLFAYFIVC